MLIDFGDCSVFNPARGRAMLGAAALAHTHVAADITDLPATPDITGKEDRANKAIANGYCDLDSSGLVPAARLPAISATGVVPIGAILPWAKTLTGTPALPAQFRECDGSVVADADSPLNGQTLPSLNAVNNFLRGNTTSGGTGGASTHTHTFSGTTDIEDGDIDVQADSGTPVTIPSYAHIHSYSGATDAGSSLPPYYDVVWIIRIK